MHLLSSVLGLGGLLENYGEFICKKNQQDIPFFSLMILFNDTVKPVLNGRDQNIFPLKPGFRLIQVHYIQYKKLNQDMQTLNWTEEKNEVLTFSLFFPVVYSLCCLTFHKHFSLRNYTKHVWIILSYGKFLQFL